MPTRSDNESCSAENRADSIEVSPAIFLLILFTACRTAILRFPITAYILWMFSLREAPFQKTLELPPTNIVAPACRIFSAFSKLTFPSTSISRSG